jgi:hypothetical protein
MGWRYTLTLEESWFMVLLVGKSDHEMIWLPEEMSSPIGRSI